MAAVRRSNYMADGLQEAMNLLEQTAIWLASGLSHRACDYSARQREPRGGL
jgi:hypothetical protein